jgi:hypothetical protein
VSKADVATSLQVFKQKAKDHDACMADAERNGQLCMFRAHARISSGYYEAVKILEKELKMKS